MASMKKRTSIVILLDHIDGMEELSDKEFGRVIRDYAEYVKNGTEPEYKTPYKRLIWKNMKNFDALNVTKMEARKEAIERYKEKQKRENANKNAQNGNQSDSGDISDIKNISDDSVYVSSSVSESVSSSVSSSSSSSVSVSESVSVSVSESVDRDTKESMSNDIPKKAAKPKVDPFVEFAGEDKELLKQLKAFAEMRTKKHKPMTDKAKKRLCTKLDREFQPCEWMEVLEQSIYHSWDDVYELKEKNQSQSQAQNTGSELDDQFARVAGMMGVDWQ